VKSGNKKSKFAFRERDQVKGQEGNGNGMETEMK